MYLAITLVLFAAFFGNVLLGSLGGKAILGDVAEMLLLVAVSISFVATILRAEQTRLRQNNNETKDPEV